MSRNIMLTRRAKPQGSRAVSRERSFEILRRPLITEKATVAQQNNTFVFEVALDANKAEIKQAVEELFEVQVQAVNTAVTKGKAKRFRGRMGRRSDVKKAYIRLAPGSTLDIGLSA